MILTLEFPIAPSLCVINGGGAFEATWRDTTAIGETQEEALTRLKHTLEEEGMLVLSKLYRGASLCEAVG